MKLKIIKIITIITSCVIAVFLLLHYGMSLGTFHGDSFEKCNKRAQGRYHFYELPDSAEDYRFICHNYGLAAITIEAFTLQGTEYDEFVNEIEKMEPGSVVGYHDKLDYTGMKVSETTEYYDDYGEYIGFPTDSIEYVIDDDINDYKILYYNAYVGSGKRIYTIVTNIRTGKILIYDYGSN